MQADVYASLVAFIYATYTAAYPANTLVIDNNPFDWNAPPPLYTEVEIEFVNGQQVNLGEDPKTRLFGFVYISVYARAGTGNKESLDRQDTLIQALKYARVGTANLQEPLPDGTSTPKGWFVRHLKIEFHTDPT